MIRIFCIGAALALTACGGPIPEDVDTYCPRCYRQIQNGQAFTPSGSHTPSQTTGGGSR